MDQTPKAKRRPPSKIKIPDILIPDVHYKFDDRTGCFIWLGTFTGNGYPTGFGKFIYLGHELWLRCTLVHRYILIKALDKDYYDEEHVAHHVCRNSRCVNLQHLMWVTKKEHSMIHAEDRRIIIIRDDKKYVKTA